MIQAGISSQTQMMPLVKLSQNDVMRLVMLQRRRYPPYSKWLGSAFRALDDATKLGPMFAAASSARSFPSAPVRARTVVRAGVDCLLPPPFTRSGSWTAAS